jgi:hypothetical protein
VVNIPLVFDRQVTVNVVDAPAAIVKAGPGATVNAGTDGVSLSTPRARSRVPRLATWKVSAAGVSVGSVPKSSVVCAPTSSSVAPRPMPRSGIDAVRSAVSRKLTSSVASRTPIALGSNTRSRPTD